MKYTQIPENTFKTMQMNAGIITTTFEPSTGTIGDIVGATSGGVQFQDAPKYSDMGDDIDNCPKNTKELKRIDSRTITMGGTFVSVSANLAKNLISTADIDSKDATHIIPRDDLLDTDFKDLWFVGDYSDVNTGDSAGFLAIHIKNALNTDGFQIQSSDKAKGQFAFTYTAHYSMKDETEVPYEVYIKAGTTTTTQS